MNDRWLVQDANGDALALVSGDHWMLLALSGGSPVDLAGEWDGRALRPFGVVTGGRYHVLPEDGDAPAQDSSAARSTGLSALASVALAGTARAANTPPAGATALDELFAGLLPRNRERSLLLCAAVEATQQLAGYVAPAGVSLPAPAPPEQLAACSPGVARIVGNMLAGEYRELLPEALRLLSEARLRLPHALLPAALAVRYSLREAMLPVVGERGRWLGGFNPTWSWVTESSDEGVSPAVEALWQTGARWQRLAALRKARAVDPALGRSWIEAVWRQEKAEFRAGMLELVGEALVSDDEPLLERALDDRAQTVTTIAADLLARMPGSALVERMRRRADTLLRYEPPAQPSGLRATLRSVFGGSNARGVLHVSLPEALPDDWLRDCIDPFPPAGRGERAWWLAQTLAVVPPVHWSSRWALEPATLLDLAAGSDEGVVVIDAWMRATARHPANEWSTAFWQALLDRRFDKSIGNVIYRVERYAELLATLPRHDAEQFVGVFIDRGNSSWEYLKALPAPWSDAFGQRWLDAAYTQLANPEAKGWDRSLEAAAGALPPACFERALELQTLGEPHISAPPRQIVPRGDQASPAFISGANLVNDQAMQNVLRAHAEQEYAEELAELRRVDDRQRPPNWVLSPWAVRTYLLGGKLPNGFEVTPKYIGNARLIEIAVATLATDRALLLYGIPGTAKSWVSEHLAAAIAGDSTLLVQGTAGTDETALRYGWNYARLLAEGPSRAALVVSPMMRAMETGKLARIEELTRIPAEVQDTLITILSEKTLPVPELNTEVQARKGFNVIATANNRDKGVNELSSALTRRFNTVVLPVPATLEEEVDIVERRVQQPRPRARAAGRKAGA